MSNIDAQKPVLICLHGWGQSHETFKELPNHSEDFHLVAIDLPGYGNNSDNIEWVSEDRATSINNWANETISLLEPHLSGASEIHILGWSLGGILAIEVAKKLLRHPEFENSSILISLLGTNLQFVASGAYQAGMAPDTFQAFLDNCNSSPEKTLKRFNLLQAQGEQDGKALGRILNKQISQSHASVLIDGLEQLNAFNLEKDILNIKGQVQLIFGEHDPLIPVSSVKEYLSETTFPQTDVHILHSVGHLALLTAPKDIVSLVSQFHWKASA